MRLIDADRLLSERMKSMYYHLPNGDIAVPVVDIENAPTIEERKSTIEFPHVFIAEGYDSIKSEDGETGFGIYDPENKQIFIAGDVPGEIFVKALLHELMHWVQDISGCAFNEGEANTFAENIYNTMESYIVTRRWIPCSERLPEESGRYIISVLDGVGRRTTVAQYQPRYKAWTMTGRMAYWKVVAWMPLPEPYREGEG